MRKTLIIIAAIWTAFPLFARTNIDDVLRTIEQNNTTLKALRQEADARKIENRTDLALPDPEIGFDYLWGSPSSIGVRKDFSVSQSLDMTTLFGLKSKVAGEKAS